jgi:sortase (surface protein transpeptidase)
MDFKLFKQSDEYNKYEILLITCYDLVQKKYKNVLEL